MRPNESQMKLIKALKTSLNYTFDNSSLRTNSSSLFSSDTKKKRLFLQINVIKNAFNAGMSLKSETRVLLLKLSSNAQATAKN